MAKNTKKPKYPKAVVQHPGINIDGYKLILDASIKLGNAGASYAERGRYFDEALAGGYDNLIAVTSDWVTLTPPSGHFDIG